MHELATSLGIFLLIIFLVGGIGNYNFYANNVYEIDQIAELLHNAQSTNNVEEKAIHMTVVLGLLGEYSGNPAWLFPMDYTNFDSIKGTLLSTVKTSLDLSLKSEVDSMSYQQSLSVIDSTVEVLHDRIHETADQVEMNPSYNPVTWWIIIIASMIGIVALWVIDYHRNEWY